MKKTLIATSIIFTLIATSFALEVDRNELNTTGNQTIEFINYTGPQRVINSAESIKQIGSELGQVISRDIENTSETGNKARYSVIHAIDPEEKGKLDADILFIGSDASVDHVRNLRRIIAGYLKSAYNYSDSDAETIAVFITVYNAVYRGDINSYNNKYKSIVTKNLTASDCGLSTNYKDWPGKSQIVIPLYDVNGGLSTIDTSVISDSKVVESMKEDDDKNIDARKDMVDLKERESEQAQEKAKDAAKTAVEEQKKLDEEKKKTAEAQKQADEAQKQAEDARKEADKNPDDKEKQQAAEEAEAKAEEAKENLEEQKAAEEEQKEKVQEAKEEAKQQQELADKKETEAQNERKDIASDQTEVQKAEAAEARTDSEYGLSLVDSTSMLSRIVKFNKEDGETIRTSPVTSIRNRTFYKVSGGYIAIVGENTENGTIKLVIIDDEKMEMTSQSNETVSELSLLVQDGSDYYCVIKAKENTENQKGKKGKDKNTEEQWVIGKYSEDLTLSAKSQIEVNPATPITATETGIVVTGSDGKLKVLSKTDLSPLNSGM